MAVLRNGKQTKTIRPKQNSMAAKKGKSNVDEMRAKLEIEQKEQALKSGLFVDTDKLKLDPRKRQGNPPLLKPATMPIGLGFRCKVVAVANSMSATVKGKLLRVEHLETKREFSLPVTGSIRQQLAPGVANDDKELAPALEKFVGKTMTIVRGADGYTAKHGGKTMYTFDVYIE
jgi:hypothetical protein